MNSCDVKKIVGERLQKVRNDRGFTREKLCDRLNRMEDAQIKNGTIKALQPDTLKQWELGKNQINVMWIPAILKVLRCDVGYLFGEYDNHTRQISDIREETGLSEDAVEELHRLNGLDSYYSKTVSMLISEMLTDETLLHEIYRSFVAVWNIKNGKSTIGEEEESNIFTTKAGGIYVFGNDAVESILFSVQKDLVKFLEKFFMTE